MNVLLIQCDMTRKGKHSITCHIYKVMFGKIKYATQLYIASIYRRYFPCSSASLGTLRTF